MQVLIVDDNVMDRKCLFNILEENFQIKAKMAKDGSEAIEKLKSNHFDLIITDIVMPNVDGIELSRYAQANFPTIKIIAITGNTPYYLIIAKMFGVEQVFEKPIDEQVITNYLSTIFQIYSEPKCV
jgi:YesN/AraC family two-component response regulator